MPGRPSGELFADFTRVWADRLTAVAEASPPRSWDHAADVIFVDGDHTAEGVTRDLEFWIDHLKPGGRLLGHDWDDARVREAVHAFAVRRGLTTWVHADTYVWELAAAGRVFGHTAALIAQIDHGGMTRASDGTAVPFVR